MSLNIVSFVMFKLTLEYHGVPSSAKKKKPLNDPKPDTFMSDMH